MAQKIRNPLAQALGLVLQSLRDKMGGVSSTEIASLLGLAASHYRMIEAGSAILQPSRTIKVIQTFETIEFIPLCQLLVAIQILDSAKDSIDDLRTINTLIREANPSMSKFLGKLDKLWDTLKNREPSQIAKKLVSEGIVKELEIFLTTEPLTFSPDQIKNFMTPTYKYPISGQLYSKIGNILQGVAPFYLDTILQLVDNLKGITPRVTPEELAGWEAGHKTRITHIIGILRNPEIILDVNTFDYSFLWQENFKKMLLVHRDMPAVKNESIKQRITDCLRKRFEPERIKYERELESLDKTITQKLVISYDKQNKNKIDKILLHRDTPMNNLWVYLMDNGYVVPFIDNALVGSTAENMYGTSLDYDETCEKLADIKEICRDAGFIL
jgi:hypothetical protein